MGQAQRPRDAGVDEGMELLAGYLFDDLPQQVVAGVVVDEDRARLARERTLPRRRHQFVERVLQPGRGAPVARIHGEVGDAAGVGQQVLDRDLFPLARRVLQVARNRRVERDLAVVDQQHDGGGREQLGRRADAEHVFGPDRHAQFHVRHAVGLAQQRPAVLEHQRRHAGQLGLEAAGDDAVERVLERNLVPWRGHGRSGKAQQQEQKRAFHRHLRNKFMGRNTILRSLRPGQQSPT